MENKKCCDLCEEKNIKRTYRSQDEKKKITKRLNIIEGQIKGIKQMIEADRYCDDVLTQLSAVNKAVESLENTILEYHMKNCISREMKSGNDEIVDEVMTLFKRLRKE